MLIETHMQGVFLPGDKNPRDRRGLIIGGEIRRDLHSEIMFPWLYLHGMKFMPLHAMKNDEVFFVCSFQQVRVTKLAIHPD